MRTTSSDMDAGQFENTQWLPGHRMLLPQTVAFLSCGTVIVCERSC